jgi:uncharacterized membrane protein YphA (DoxX/SURF4 family)
MNAGKRWRILHWVFTLVAVVPTAGSGIPELFGSGLQTTIRTVHALGYPLYIMKILGFAKVVGAVAIVTGRYPTFKEWAYAGFSFEFLGSRFSMSSPVILRMHRFHLFSSC